MTTSAADEPAPRRSFRLLLDPVYGPYFVGKLLSVGGVWIHNVSAALLAFILTESALVVGLVSVVQFAPQMLTPWSGAIADRGNRAAQIIIGRVVTVLGSGGFAVAYLALGADNEWTIAALMSSSFMVGIGFVVGGPAMHALVPTLVTRSELATVIALDSVPMIAGRSVGPLIGTLLLLQFGATVSFTAAALAHLPYIVVLLLLRSRGVRRTARGSRTSVIDGLRYVRPDRVLVVSLIGGACVGFGTDPALTLVPSIASQFPEGPHLVGWFASSFGIGAAAGVITIGWARGRLGLPRLPILGMLLIGGSSAAVAAAWSPLATVIAFGAMGMGMSWALTGFGTQIQARVDEDFRGRVMSLWLLAQIGVRPLAAAWNGGIADAWGTPTVLLLDAFVILTAAAWCHHRTRPAGHHR